MARRGYALVFVVIVLLAGIGGIFGARFLLQRLQADFAPRQSWAPPTAVVPGPAVDGVPTSGATVTPIVAGEPTSVRPTATMLVVATPEDVAPLEATATPTLQDPGTPGELIPPDTGTPEGTPTETITPTVAAPEVYPFVLARPIRDSAGDCPGSYVLGQVTDRAANPLPDIRLKLVDEYGNVAYALSKSGPGDKGLYDFPVTGPPRRLKLMVIDADDQPSSESVDIGHQVGDTPDATCHWVDWQRR